MKDDVVSMCIPLSLAICIIFVCSGVLTKQIRKNNSDSIICHESCFAAILGIVIGGMIRIRTHQPVKFDPNFFFYVVLPPIIFSAGYSLKRKNFFRYALSIVTFGILGTLLNFGLISFAAHSYHYYFGGAYISWPSCMLLASVLSASDEVSAMSLVRMKDYPHLGSLIFGEGVLNDALSLVLFKALQSSTHSGFSGRPLWDMVGDISITVVLQVVWSCVVGLFCGLLNARLFKVFPEFHNHPVHQTSLVLLFGMLAYSIAEYMGVSGILTLFVAAVTLAHYSWHSLSGASQISTKLSLSAMSDIAEGFAFSYVGLSLWGFTNDGETFSLSFSVFMLFSVIVSRFVVILGVCAVLSPLLSEFQLPFREQVGFSLGGVVRGCLCWAQILQIQDQPLLLTCTLFVVMSTTLGCGFLLPVILPRLIPVKRKPLVDLDRSEAANGPSHVLDSSFQSSEQSYQVVESSRLISHSTTRRSAGPPMASALFILWLRFDEHVMKVIFGGSSRDELRTKILNDTSTLSVLAMLTNPGVAQHAVQSASLHCTKVSHDDADDQEVDYEEEFLAILVDPELSRGHIDAAPLSPVFPRPPGCRRSSPPLSHDGANDQQADHEEEFLGMLVDSRSHIDAAPLSPVFPRPPGSRRSSLPRQSGSECSPIHEASDSVHGRNFGRDSEVYELMDRYQYFSS